ncbi:glycosyltransferase family 87 protein [Paragemmobacter ruber]|uniref:DUF2029 domain-containing protein n=1 Tax=Paragemmobacter ruber TaxID=1985673 RepID=A0ABW9Y3H8_9RHOB|nr:glycosyltransferase family 87 protein [Rhodobacter ruber]NBE07058.1 DUF2029 domain-containing protein [Rhodobacter ruber]
MFSASHSPISVPCSATEELAKPRTILILALLCLVAGLKTVVDFYMKSEGLTTYVMTDIDTFWLAGWLYWDGRLDDAYRTTTLFAAQATVLDSESFMPYTYPPQYNFLSVALGAVPIWISYAIFVPLSFALYVVAVRNLAPGHLGLVFLLIFPAILVNVRTGQNGLLVAGLVALAARGIIAPHLRAGFALGLAAIKPHIAIGIGAAAILTGQWRLAALAIATCLVTLAAAAAVFGTEMFTLMLSASAEAMGFLKMGVYPLHRMVSVYAFLRSFGAPAELALAVQSIFALLTVGGLLFMAYRRVDRVVLVAAAIVAPLFISPYAYDYDMTLVGVALALLATRLIARARPGQMTILLGLLWVATVWGIPTTLIRDSSGLVPTYEDPNIFPSVQALLNIATVLFVARILRQAPTTTEERALA